MEIRTFYWHDRIIGKFEFFKRKLLQGPGVSSKYFSVGNAGDIFAVDILRFFYGESSIINTRKDGHRILPVGSIGHTILAGDVLCGVGIKGENTVPPDNGNLIYGLRGPLTYEAFKKKGHDVSNVKFLLDPGLLMRFMTDHTSIEAKDVIFIPHYRERFVHKRKLPKGIKFVDIDSDPIKLAKEILSAKLVYSSSLHGIIFSHALNRPCVSIKPLTEEPEFKYKDYYASVNVPYKKPLDSITQADFARDSDTPASVNYKREDFVFPSLEDLKRFGIAK